MFQYAAARRLAHYTGQQLDLDLCYIRAYGSRNFGLDHLRIPDKYVATPLNFSRSVLGEKLSKLKKMLVTGRVPIDPRVVTESGFHFDPRILDLKGSVRLEGYWQSPGYFKDIEAIIRREFEIRNPANPVNEEFASRIRTEKSISVHVRCGDYLNDPATQAYHGNCSMKYYQDAIIMMTDFEPTAHFYIFSDDPAWTRNNLIVNRPHTFISHNGVEQAHEDLRLTSLCTHHIIANSAFSWWAAWLNTNPDRKVMAPKQWFKTPDCDTSDLIPTDWIRL
jgi:hypothetical protein